MARPELDTPAEQRRSPSLGRFARTVASADTRGAAQAAWLRRAQPLAPSSLRVRAPAWALARGLAARKWQVPARVRAETMQLPAYWWLVQMRAAEGRRADSQCRRRARTNAQAMPWARSIGQHGVLREPREIPQSRRNSAKITWPCALRGLPRHARVRAVHRANLSKLSAFSPIRPRIFLDPPLWSLVPHGTTDSIGIDRRKQRGL